MLSSERYGEERTYREGDVPSDATRRSRIETRQRRHKSLYEARKTRRGQVCGSARQTKIQIGIVAVFKAPADRERVCILNEPERCRRCAAVDAAAAQCRGEKTARHGDRRSGLKKFTRESRRAAPRRSASGRRESCGRRGRKVTYRVVRANRFLFRRR